MTDPIFDAASPSWLRSVVYLGVPSVIALFLVWVLSQAIIGRLVAIDAQLDALAALVRQTCLVAAQTPDERGACVRP